MAEEPEEQEQYRVRRESADRWRNAGFDPYGARLCPHHYGRGDRAGLRRTGRANRWPSPAG